MDVDEDRGMSMGTTNSTARVLHIRPDSHGSASADNMSALLESVALSVEVCGDVYRGLARLCRKGDDRQAGWPVFRAAIVCVDDLGTPEFEFFTVVSRACREIDTYVYGHGQSATRIARSIELGATGRATEDVIRALANTAVVESSQDPVSKAEADTLQPAEVDDLLVDGADDNPGDAHAPRDSTWQAPSVTDEVEEPVVADEFEQTANIEVPSSPVPVPWLSRSNLPRRTAPGRPTPNDEPGTQETASAQPSRHEPLLTEAELRALVGDDIASIAPAEPDPNPQYDSDETGGPP